MKSNENSFKLQVEKDIEIEDKLTKVELVVKLGQMQSIESFDVAETSLERIFQQFIMTDEQIKASKKQQKLALKFSNAVRSESELTSCRGSGHKPHVREPQQETTFIMTQHDLLDNKEPVVVSQNAYHHYDYK